MYSCQRYRRNLNAKLISSVLDRRDSKIIFFIIFFLALRVCLLISFQLAFNIIAITTKEKERYLKNTEKAPGLPIYIIGRSVSILSIHYSSGIKVESLRIAFAVNPNGEKCLIQIQMLIDPAVDPRAFGSPLYLLVETGDRGESHLM